MYSQGEINRRGCVSDKDEWIFVGSMQWLRLFLQALEALSAREWSKTNQKKIGYTKADAPVRLNVTSNVLGEIEILRWWR